MIDLTKLLAPGGLTADLSFELPSIKRAEPSESVFSFENQFRDCVDDAPVKTKRRPVVDDSNARSEREVDSTVEDDFDEPEANPYSETNVDERPRQDDKPVAKSNQEKSNQTKETNADKTRDSRSEDAPKETRKATSKSADDAQKENASGDEKPTSETAAKNATANMNVAAAAKSTGKMNDEAAKTKTNLKEVKTVAKEEGAKEGKNATRTSTEKTETNADKTTTLVGQNAKRNIADPQSEKNVKRGNPNAKSVESEILKKALSTKTASTQAKSQSNAAGNNSKTAGEANKNNAGVKLNTDPNIQIKNVSVESNAKSTRPSDDAAIWKQLAEKSRFVAKNAKFDAANSNENQDGGKNDAKNDSLPFDAKTKFAFIDKTIGESMVRKARKTIDPRAHLQRAKSNADGNAKLSDTAFQRLQRSNDATAGLKTRGNAAANQTNAAANSRNIAVIQEIMGRIRSLLNGQTAFRGTRMSMDFQSDHLGRMNLALQERDGNLSVNLEVGNDSSRQQLLDQRNELSEQLKAMGYKDVSVSVGSRNGGEDRQNHHRRQAEGNENEENVKLAGDQEFDLSQILAG